MPGGRPLVGRHVRLDPTVEEDAQAIFEALDHEQVWAGGYAGGPSGRAGSAQWWVQMLHNAREESRAMFTVRLLADDRVVGTTSLGDTVVPHARTHLGWTAYAPGVWGGVVNPECKLLLLAHAFDDCGFGRVKIQTDLVNLRSQAAIAKLGAAREGVLRRHMVRPDGTTRDTVVFAVTVDDWPRVRAGLLDRVGG